MLGDHPKTISQRRLDLFPTNVWQHTLDPTGWCEHYSRVIKTMQTTEGRTNSNGNWCSPDDLDQRPEWLPLKELILTTADQVVKDQAIVYHRIRMNCMWANLHPKHSQHQQHTHPNSHYSGVVYLQIPSDDAGDFYLRDPRLQAQTWVFDYEQDRDPGDHYRLTPKTGDLLIFPSWLEHGTIAHTSDEERICVSFNLWLETEVKTKHTVRNSF